MGAVINRFNGGLDQDTNIQDYSNQKYVDAMNMSIISKDDFRIGSIESEPGMATSLSFPTVNVLVLDVTVEGTWGGTFEIGTNDPTITIPAGTHTSKIGASLTYPPPAAPEGDAYNYRETPNNSYVYVQNEWAVIQYLNRIVIISYAGDTITVTPGGGTGTLTQVATYGAVTNPRVLGSVNLRNSTILFTTAAANTSIAPTNTIGQIWKVTFSTSGAVTSSNVELLYTGILKFSTYYPIEAKSFFINEKYGKVYFTDNYNSLRHFNAYDHTMFAKDSTQFDLIADVQFTQPKLVELVDGGNYKSGVVQYAYQFYNRYGTETIMSPISNLIPLSASSENLNVSNLFVGSPKDENTNKAIQLVITPLDERFEYVRVFAVHYEDADTNPTINIVIDQKIQTTSPNVLTVIDDGYHTLGTLTMQEFRNYYRNLFGAKTIELYNNRLVAANLNESFFDVSYDARTYRWNAAGTHFYSDAPRTLYSEVELYDDCLNYSDYNTYKWNTAGDVGGTGPNISYKFYVQEMLLDAYREYNLSGARKGTQLWSTLVSSEFIDNHSFTNYASPVNASQMVGYKRGEIYRFGVLFRDSKGRISPVKWIGDIKFPETYDEVGLPYSQGSSSGRQYLDNSADKIAITYEPNGWDQFDNPTEEHYWIYDAGEDGDIVEYVLTITIDSTDYIMTVESNQIDAFYYISQIHSFLSEHDLRSLLSLEYDLTQTDLTLTFYVNDTVDRTIDISITLDGVVDSTFINTARVETADGADQTDNNYVVNLYDSPSAFSGITARVLYPVFTVNNIPTDEFGNLCSYQIVRARRTEKDKTIVMQGLLGAPVYEFPVDFHMGKELSPKTDIVGKTFLYMVSPEVNFRKTKVKSTDKLYITGYTLAAGLNRQEKKIRNIESLSSFVEAVLYDNGIIESDGEVLDPRVQMIKDYRMYNVVKDSNNKTLGASGTVLGLATATVGAVTTPNGTDILIGEIRRTLTNQYGGSTYYNKINTEYIDCGHFSAGHSGSKVNHVFGGDTYICIFDYQRTMWIDKGINNKIGDYYQVLYLPVETSINLDYRYDKSYSKVYVSGVTKYNINTAKFLQERSGDYSGLVGKNEADDKYSINYFQEYDLYLENRAYSKDNDTNIYLAQPLETDGEETDCLIRVSEEFSYNSNVDDLIRFLPINFKIVNTQYGEITKLVNFNNNVYFFQNRATGVIPIAERTLINDSKGIGLVLGTGDLFGKPQYISTISGTKYQSSVTATERGIYYFDSQTRSLNRITANVQEVSTLTGLGSYFTQRIVTALGNYDNRLAGYGVHTAYDYNRKRLLFTMLYAADSSNDFTVSYNELIDSFESFHTYKPQIYLNDPHGNLHSENPASLGSFYVHDKGNYGLFYGTYAASYITYLVSAEPLLNKKFTNVEMDWRIGITDLSSSTDTRRLTHAISKIKFWNDYQTTNDLDTVIYPTAAVAGTSVQIRQKFGVWRLAIPSIIVSTKYTRLFDKHMFTKVTYTNDANNYRFVLNNATTYYQPAQY